MRNKILMISLLLFFNLICSGNIDSLKRTRLCFGLGLSFNNVTLNINTSKFYNYLRDLSKNYDKNDKMFYKPSFYENFIMPINITLIFNITSEYYFNLSAGFLDYNEEFGKFSGDYYKIENKTFYSEFAIYKMFLKRIKLYTGTCIVYKFKSFSNENIHYSAFGSSEEVLFDITNSIFFQIPICLKIYETTNYKIFLNNSLNLFCFMVGKREYKSKTHWPIYDANEFKNKTYYENYFLLYKLFTYNRILPYFMRLMIFFK